MPNLSLTLDYGLKIILEPGFSQELTAAQLATLAQAVLDGASPSGLWCDPLTNTVMLRPLQLNNDWLGTAQAGPSIVRLANLAVNATDTAAGTLFEAAVFGNSDDPWIYHVAVGPSSFFPAAVNPFPGTPPSLGGYSTPVDPTATDLSLVRVNTVYQPSTTVPPANMLPGASPIGGTGDGKFIGETTRWPANQAFYFRWYQPPSRIGFPATYSFYAGQFRIDIREVVAQVFQDISSGGDRSAWKHVGTYPLWAAADAGNTGIGGNWISNMASHELIGHDRSLLWLPFRRNQVLLMSNFGKGYLLQTQAVPSRLPDNTDWRITRSDTVLVWVLTPHWGRFQVQQVAYTTTPLHLNLPAIQLDYTPTAAPASVLHADTDHGTALTAAQSQPPSYTLPINNANDCPPAPTSPPGVQNRSYGHALSFTASSDGRWSPYFYNLEVTSPTIFQAAIATPTVVTDTSAGHTSYVVKASIVAGKNPGEGRATIEVEDFSPFSLAGYYHRSGNPIQLTQGGTAVFTGITLPQEVTPLKLQTDTPRRITFSASDRWYQLTHSFLRDTRSWGGVGHIDAVETIMQLGGIDTSTIETPPKNTMNNTVMGGPVGNTGAPALQRDVQPPWKPHPPETAAAFIQRIAEKFAGWEVGFEADGTPYYRPRYFFTASEVTFYESAAAATADGHPGAPLYRSPVTETTEEPEANVILVRANSAQNGQPIYSSLWVDFASIYNTAALNYCGRQKPEVVDLGRAAFSCAELNRIARQIWQFTRRRHVTARFQADYTSLVKVGHVLTLHGKGDYRVQSYTAEYEKSTWSHMVIEAELVEQGF